MRRAGLSVGVRDSGSGSDGDCVNDGPFRTKGPWAAVRVLVFGLLHALLAYIWVARS